MFLDFFGSLAIILIDCTCNLRIGCKCNQYMILWPKVTPLATAWTCGRWLYFWSYRNFITTCCQEVAYYKINTHCLWFRILFLHLASFFWTVQKSRKGFTTNPFCFYLLFSSYYLPAARKTTLHTKKDFNPSPFFRCFSFRAAKVQNKGEFSPPQLLNYVN